MANTQQLIEDFFKEKIQETISTGYDEILKPIRDKKKNHKHKEYLEKCTKEEEAIESNQWMREKLNRCKSLFNSDQNLSELTQKTINLYQETLDQNELKIILALQFKALRKEVNKAELSEQDKKSFETIETEKLQSDKFKKNIRLLERLAEIDPEISIAMREAKQIAQEKFEKNTWITEAALKAGEVSVGMTHIAKLTHSSTRASNIDATAFDKNASKNLLVTVNCSKELKKDFAYSSAAYAQIAEFLQLTGTAICTNPTALKPFTQDDDQLKAWQEQFSLVLSHSCNVG